MNRRMLSLLDRLCAAGAALLVFGFGGAVTGAMASLSIAVLFVGPYALYASLWGALSGFCAAVCGAGLGGPLGWKLSGAFWGSYGGYNLVVLLSRAPATHTDGLAALLVLWTSGLAGWMLSAFAASRFEPLAINAVPVGPSAQLARHSPLSSLPFPIRLGLVAGHLLPVLVTIPEALAHIGSVWSRMLEIR